MDLSSRLAGLPESERYLLHAAEAAGRRTSVPVYWVGGGVRDLLTGRLSAPDLDLVVEGDLDPFADALAAELDAREVRRSPFLTRELEAARPVRTRIDVARARAERYDAPAELPRVEPAGLAADLLRRDFTVNSLAIPLHPGFGSRIIDVSGGLDDLGLRALRLHHERSFADDPSRLLRGVDFETRLGFRFAPTTEELARAACAEGALGRLSGARLRAAALRAFGRPATASAAWERADELGLSGAIHLALARRGALRSWFTAALSRIGVDPADESPSTELLVLGLVSRLLDRSEEEREEIAGRLDLDSRSSWVLVLGPTRVAAIAADLHRHVSASEAHRLLRELSRIELALLADRGAEPAEWVERELGEMRAVRLSIDGRSLLERGVAAGPRLGAALARTLDARLDGRIGAEEELEFALAQARPGNPR
jgi:tRNA nucleotidyltransferase (CCA-adding enzyme)